MKKLLMLKMPHVMQFSNVAANLLPIVEGKHPRIYNLNDLIFPVSDFQKPRGCKPGYKIGRSGGALPYHLLGVVPSTLTLV